METKSALNALSALAQNSRLTIYRHLVELGPQGTFAGRIAEALEIAPAMLSFHLKELSHARLVKRKQDGRFVRYAANFSTMNQLIAYLTENCCSDQPELCAHAYTPITKTAARKKGTR